MAFLKQLASNMAGKILGLYEGQQGCCGEDGDLNVCSVSVLTSLTLQKITIDGVEYTFTVDGTDPATIKAGIRESFVTGTPNAGYDEVAKVGVSAVVNGGDWDIIVTSSATVLKLTDSIAGDHTFTCV